MLKDLLVNYTETTEIEGIEYSGPRYYGNTTERYVYNPSVSQPLHKFLYMITNCKIESKKYDSKNDSCTMRIVTTRKDKKFIKSTSNLNSHLDKMIKKYNDRDNVSRSIDKLVSLSDNYPPVITVHADNTSMIMNHKGDEIKSNKIRNGSRVMVLIEFVKVIFNPDNVKKIWRIVQMKEIKELDITKDIFSMDIISNYNTDETMFKKQISIPPPPPPPSMMPSITNPNTNNSRPSRANLLSEIANASLSSKSSSKTNSNNNKPKETNTGGSFFPPSKDLLANAIARLKKRDDKADEVVDNTADNTVDNTTTDDNICSADEDEEESVIDSEEEYDNSDNDDNSTDDNSDDDTSSSVNMDDIEKLSKDIMESINENERIFDENLGESEDSEDYEEQYEYDEDSEEDSEEYDEQYEYEYDYE